MPTDLVDASLVRPDGSAIPLHENCSIGRGDQNDCALSDQLASRRHAVVQRQGDNEYWLVDYGSRNGTYLNGRRIAQPSRLNNGDIIAIGETQLRFDQRSRGGAAERGTVGDLTVFNVRPSRAWLLVADVIGSSRFLAHSNLNEVPVIMGKWLIDCREVIERHGGRINQFMGDGYFAYWPDQDGIEASVLAALDALMTLQATARPDFRMVLHLGNVVLGGLAIGEEERISGGEVNFVFRMEKLAGSLQLNRLVSAPVKDRLAERLVFRDQGLHSVAGFDGEHPFFSCDRASPG